MARIKQDRKEEWEREHVQRVLDYHNKTYRTHIAIKGKSTDLYPYLKGQLNWDWVCYDTETSEEIAVEVKKLTDPELEERGNIMWQLLEEVKNSFSESKKLPGTFSLSVNIPKNYYLPLNEQKNRQEFKRVLSEAIYRMAQKLKPRETEDLMSQINEQLPVALPDSSYFNLHKFSDEGNVLYKGSGTIGWWSIGFDELELEKFNDLVSWANMQLKAAHVQETFLVLIEEGHRPIDPPEIEKAFTKINAETYSEIRHVYFIRGEEVVEIPLPTP